MCYLHDDIDPVWPRFIKRLPALGHIKFPDNHWYDNSFLLHVPCHAELLWTRQVENRFQIYILLIQLLSCSCNIDVNIFAHFVNTGLIWSTPKALKSL